MSSSRRWQDLPSVRPCDRSSRSPTTCRCEVETRPERSRAGRDRGDVGVHFRPRAHSSSPRYRAESPGSIGGTGPPMSFGPASTGPPTGSSSMCATTAFGRHRWGERPGDPAIAESYAREHLDRVPRLVPIYGHRYLTADPAHASSPVFSVYQTDVIYYGDNLLDYIASPTTSGVDLLPGQRRPVQSPSSRDSIIALAIRGRVERSIRCNSRRTDVDDHRPPGG